ncbi:branched-chain-amino-acid transaminase [Atribacter laminatus]|uniref:Branched-chain-amino-acid aminotransferase n=1 Tax=Atribacter laminatus TaxID=2847778 RepID=A0A7T1F1M8_ATRLM|nr:branched-chain-amino-acid transaminase [Atribacter laminatus]QPM67148.1 Branched-chain-amino-acid aminotransferase [Atribacter laminatus]
MQELSSIWLNGKIVDWKDATTHVLTHALHYGTSVFEGIRCYKTLQGSAVFRLGDHIQRLFDSARIIKMCIPYSHDELYQATLQTIRENQVDECYIRPLVFRGYGEMGVDPTSCEVISAIAVWRWGAYMGEKGLKHGIRAKISSYTRNSMNASSPRAKTSANYLNSALAKTEAKELGYDEAILLDMQGFVSEGSGENIFIVKNGVLYTPHPYSILLGITRDTVIRLALDLEFDVRETHCTRDDLYLADEAFFTGTAAEITPIVEIDGRPIGDGKPGPVTRQLQEIFFRVIRGEEETYIDWLDYVEKRKE